MFCVEFQTKQLTTCLGLPELGLGCDVSAESFPSWDHLSPCANSACGILKARLRNILAAQLLLRRVTVLCCRGPWLYGDNNLYWTMPYSAMPCDAISFFAMLCYTMPCHAIKCHTLRHHTILYPALPYYTIRICRDANPETNTDDGLPCRVNAIWSLSGGF